MSEAVDDAQDAAESAKTSPPVRALARLGFCVNGVLHILIGVIAIQVAIGVGHAEADQSGALRQLASTPGGYVVLWVVVVGLLALVVWQVIEAVVVNEPDRRKRWTRRATELAKGVGYAVVGVSALVFAVGGGSSSANSSRTLTGALLSTPAGVVLIVAAGVAVFVVGVSFVVIGIRRRFSKLMTIPSGALGTAVSTVTIIGYIAKGIAIAVVGVLFVVAALTADPSRATGLDGALKSLAALPFGAAVLVAVGIGLIAFGVSLFARARWARL
jgi:hypothetical protein